MPSGIDAALKSLKADAFGGSGILRGFGSFRVQGLGFRFLSWEFRHWGFRGFRFFGVPGRVV